MVSSGFNSIELLFRMPNSGELREKWIQSIESHQQFSSNDEHTLYYTVCSNHFERTEITGGVNRRLKPGVYPTLFPMNVVMNASMNDDLPELEQVTDYNINVELIKENEK